MRPDEFEPRVRELIRLHGPADALEPARALDMAAEVLVHCLIETNNRIAAYGAPCHRNQFTPLYRAVYPVERAAFARVREDWPDTALAIAGVIAATCFDAARQRSYLDTDEVAILVGATYGVAIQLLHWIRDLAYKVVMKAEGEMM